VQSHPLQLSTKQESTATLHLGGNVVIENLSSKQRDDVLRTLLHYMPPDLRRKIMVQHPEAYVRMAPHTRDAVIRRVADALKEIGDGIQ
jgi:hypothetical protein